MTKRARRLFETMDLRHQGVSGLALPGRTTATGEIEGMGKGPVLKQPRQGPAAGQSLGPRALPSELL